MLREEQQQLLHAWLDGEATEAESNIALELLARPEVASHVLELRRLRALVLTHASVKAPSGLAQRVRDALGREAGAPVIRLHIWRSAILAAAAAVVVSLGLMFSDSLLVNDAPPASPCAVIGDVADSRQPAERPGDGRVNTTPAPMPPSPPTDEKSDEKAEEVLVQDKSGKRATSVLSLDRGLDQPLELSLHMDTSRKASTPQVYNDMLIVSSLYGDAELKDSEVENAASFNGRDYSEFDGVLVEVELDRVPELIAALNRMTADQAYGAVVVPNDLRASIESNTVAVSKLQRATRGPGPKGDTGAGGNEAGLPLGARGYLPPRVQRECLESELKDRPDELRRLEAMDDLQFETDDDTKATLAGAADSHKIKLVLRLR